MADFPKEPDYSHPLFQSPAEVAKFVYDRLENDQGAMSGPELAAALYHVATNLDLYIQEQVRLRIKVENALGGGDEGQRMMDKIEEHRDQYRLRSGRQKDPMGS